MLKLFGCIAVLVVSIPVSGQAPAGATGQCKDGTYTTAAKKTGACSRHQGVQIWFADSSSKGSAPTTPAPTKTATPPTAAPQSSPRPTAAPSPIPTPKANTPMASTTPAAGGGPGMVWVNTPTHVYHCSGTRYYGNSKSGKYMTEAAAKSEGDHPDHGKGCGL